MPHADDDDDDHGRREPRCRESQSTLAYTKYAAYYMLSMQIQRTRVSFFFVLPQVIDRIKCGVKFETHKSSLRASARKQTHSTQRGEAHIRTHDMGTYTQVYVDTIVYINWIRSVVNQRRVAHWKCNSRSADFVHGL